MAFEVFKPARRNWTSVDDEILVAMVAEDASTIAIARRLNRTPRAVTMQIWRIYGGPTGRPRGRAAASNRWRPA